VDLFRRTFCAEPSGTDIKGRVAQCRAGTNESTMSNWFTSSSEYQNCAQCQYDCKVDPESEFLQADVKKSEIPRILHRVMIPNEQGVLTCDQSMNVTRVNFRAHNQDWVEYVWGYDTINKLLQKSQHIFARESGIEDFASLFQDMPQWIYQQDTIRHLILYHYGGLYMDTDMDCKADVSHLLDGASLVVRAKGKTNFLAAKPHHPFFLDMMKRISNTFREGIQLITTPLELTGERQIARTLLAASIDCDTDNLDIKTFESKAYGVVKMMGPHQVVNEPKNHKKHIDAVEHVTCIHRAANLWHNKGSTVPVVAKQPKQEIFLAPQCTEVYDQYTTWGQELIETMNVALFE